jgi:tetratricopeptide (TPR) repeat protein
MSKRREPTAPPTPAASKPPVLLPSLALAALTLLAFAPALGGQYIWDDDDYVHANPNLRNDAGLADIWFHPTYNPQYYPLVFTTFWLEWRMWGDRPAGYHAVNVLLHAASAILLWRLLRRLEVPGAYLAAAVFAVHPITVESVAWITERKNALSLVFYLLAAGAYLRFAQLGPRNLELGTSDSPRWGTYALSLLFFLCALLSKTVTATLPAALLLVLWWKRGHIEWRHVALLLPCLALGILAGLHTGYLERHHVGAQGPEWNWSPLDRILIAGRAVWFYAAKIVAPVRLSFIYPKWTIDPHQPWQWLFPLALLSTLGTLVALRNRIGRGPLVAALFFVGTLVPALGFVNVFPMRYSFVADHFQYHASIGLIALLAAGLTLAATQYPRQQRLIAGSSLVAALAVLTFARCCVFASADRLWNDTLAKNPNSWMVWTNLAHLAEARNDPAAAAQAYRKAHELAPNVLDTRFNLAALHSQEGQTDQAIAELEQIVKEEPRYALAHQHLARLLRRQGKLEQAATHLESALAAQPGNLDMLRELADTRIKQANYKAAEPPLRKILEQRPNDADTLFDLAIVLKFLNRLDEAEPLLSRAISLKPELARRLSR